MPLNIRYQEWPEGTKFKKLKSVDYLVIHHTASQHDAPIEEIHRWHKERGWVGTGYHFLIRFDGSVEGGRPEDAVGAHVEGYNTRSLGIALNGDFMAYTPTPEQMTSLVALLRELLAKHPQAEVVAHKHLEATACPGAKFPWDTLQKLLRSPAQKNTPSPWAEKSWQKAIANLIMDGTRPHDPLTREELAVILDRLGLLKEKVDF